MLDETDVHLTSEYSLDAVVAEYITEEEAGRAIDLRQFVARYPRFAGELRSFFANREQMQRLTKSLRVPAGSGHSANHNQGIIRAFGDYELLEEIATGGMGIVYKSHQISLNRIVAIKMILKGKLANEADVRRFQTEAEAAAGLQHQAIVAIHEVGMHEGQHYFSMDFVDGCSLAQLLREQ